MSDTTAAALRLIAQHQAARLAAQPQSLLDARADMEDAFRVYQATRNPNDLREWQRKKAAYEAEKARVNRPQPKVYGVVGEAYQVQPLAA